MGVKGDLNMKKSSSTKHQLFLVKGYTFRGMRVYRCTTCNKDTYGHSKKDAQQRHEAGVDSFS